MRNEPKNETYQFNEKDIVLTFSQMKPSESLCFIMYLGKIIGGSAGKFIAAMDGAKLADLVDKGEFNMDKIGDAVATLFDRFEEKETIAKLNLLLSSVKTNGQPLYIDHPMFVGNLKDLFKVIKTAIGVNYKDFLDEISAALKKVFAKMQSLKSTLKAQP